ncbi:MAG: ribulose-phosphate 3-epimerase [Patescibacteria group bacterium]
MPHLLIAPSILSADFGKLNEEIASVEGFVDLIHVDVMDGHFVPNLSLGVPVVESIRCKKPLDVHLMIQHPEHYVEAFAKAVKKAVGEKLAAKSYLVFHAETSNDHLGLIAEIHKLGLLAGVALNPDSPLGQLSGDVLSVVDMVLLMTVFPGFGGQSFIATVVPKIRELRDLSPELNIQVDGGINDETVFHARKAGANVIVAGSYVFGATNREKAVTSLKAEF